MKILIQSNKKLQFPPSSIGFVDIEIDLAQINPILETWSLRLVDKCWDIFPVKDEEGKVIKNEDGTDKTEIKILGTNPRGLKTYTFAELSMISSMLPISMTDKAKLSENIAKALQYGILLVTQKECMDGISGMPGKGMYFSSAEDWIIPS